MEDKKLIIKRLLIYLAFAFGLAWILFFGFYYGGHYKFGDNRRIDTFVGLGMMAPLLANIITRKITGEGFALTGKGSLMLGINLKNKRWIFFIIAVLLPWLFNEINSIIVALCNPEAFDVNNYRIYEMDKTLTYMSPIILIVSACISSFAALGEEGGWRGYMMPKLFKLMGAKKALVVGGVIWGLWHLPLTCVGHNFGTEYPGFPFVGILIMCIFCIFTGTVLTYITIRSESIWPAALMHAVINASPGILKYFIDSERLSDISQNVIFVWGVLILPTVIAAIICIHKMGKH